MDVAFAERPYLVFYAAETEALIALQRRNLLTDPHAHFLLACALHRLVANGLALAGSAASAASDRDGPGVEFALALAPFARLLVSCVSAMLAGHVHLLTFERESAGSSSGAVAGAAQPEALHFPAQQPPMFRHRGAEEFAALTCRTHLDGFRRRGGAGRHQREPLPRQVKQARRTSIMRSWPFFIWDFSSVILP
ncbi:hypothetical protein [Nonomuraea sp. KM88]|uniref:hypothetical protein n=1 Tax=Nonomuraea sp. KM88 TaxID=3457427 RepID=UPI003FCDCBCA